MAFAVRALNAPSASRSDVDSSGKDKILAEISEMFGSAYWEASFSVAVRWGSDVECDVAIFETKFATERFSVAAALAERSIFVTTSSLDCCSGRVEIACEKCAMLANTSGCVGFTFCALRNACNARRYFSAYT